MDEINNMYVGKSADKRQWQKPFYRYKQILSSLFFLNGNKSPKKGHICHLPSQYSDFKPNWNSKNYKPVDYSHLKNAPIKEIRSAVNWIDENIGWYHSIDLKNGITTPGGTGWRYRKKIFDMARRIKGKTVLDVGAM